MQHHAVVFEGERTAALAAVHRYAVDTIGITVEANPDVVRYVHDQYTIDDARALYARTMQAPLGEQQLFILQFDRITREAQNALLKLLEEPPADTHIVLTVPTQDILLPTVRSRLSYGGRVEGVLEETALATAFLGAAPTERVKLLEPLYKGIKDSDKQAARTRARTFVDALESLLCAQGVRERANALTEVAFVRQYLGDTSSSLKMLLEHLAYAL